jgi:hypothetical protein
VPVFLERFVLPAFAAILVALLLVNPMKFDATQRITGAVVIIAAAYFVGHTIYLRNQPKPPMEFAIPRIINVINQNDRGTIGALYEQNGTTYSTQVNCFLILQITVKDKPITLGSISVDIRTEHGWMPLRRLPSTLRFFMGPVDQARQISFLETDLASFIYQDVEAWKTIKGFGVYDFSDASYVVSKDDPPETYRITLTNSLGETNQTEIELPNGDGSTATAADAYAGQKWSVRIVNATPTNLLQYESKPFYSRN